MQSRFTLFIISMLSLLTVSCNILKPVTIKGVSNFKTINTGTAPEFRFDVSLFNPNKYSVIIEKMDFGIFLDTLALTKTTLLQETEITRKEASIVTVAMTPGTGSMNEIFRAGVNGILSGNIDRQFSVQGEIKIRKFIFKRKYRFSEALKL